ncbi:FAD-dependent oxidoreductase [Streptomyces sp. NPDC096046]|uniref:FAD-dependent oxidoreductase n=1 Tax=Streptomyces sp. NPDC096046 TaxID=3155542 RepID=UPI003326001F
MPDPTLQTPRQPTVDVLVVGGGPTGLTLACDLARRGVRTHVIETADELSAGSRGKSLQARTLETFDDLGVDDALKAAGAAFPPMQTWRDGERQGEWQLIEPDPEAPVSRHPQQWLVPQWRTQDILRDRLLELGGTLECGARLTSLTQADTHVTAEVARTDGGSRVMTALYLVGADGSHSTVRESLGIAMKGEDRGLRSAVVADVRVRGLDRDHWHIWPDDPPGELLLCPLPGTADFQLNAKITGEEFTATPETVRGLVAARTHLPSDAVTDVRWCSFYRPRTALAERFRQGRVLLAGDAAHLHPPGGGQGLNIGVQDAYNLGWKLGQVIACHAPDTLLDSYEAERRPAAAGVLDLSTRLYRAGRKPEDGDQSRYRGRVCHLLSVHYRGSELSVDARERRSAAGVQAGDRVPDLACVTPDGSCRNLFDLLRGPHFTLLAVNCAPPAVTAGIRTHQVTDGPLARELGTGLFLIRPDHHIGLAADGPEQLGRYLARFGLRNTETQRTLGAAAPGRRGARG